MANQNNTDKTPSPSNRAQQIFTRAIHSLHMSRAAPPRIPIPITPPSVSFARTATPPLTPLPVEQAMQWATTELSDYPPQFTRQDVRELFKNFTISPEFTLPNAVNLAYPLRTLIKIAGQQEAERAVQELRWIIIGGRAISVKMAEKTSQKEAEKTTEEFAEEKKNEIINIARVYYPHLTYKLLEVREHSQGFNNFAFLQARDATPAHEETEAHMQPGEWELVASGRCGGWSWQIEDGSGRLAALKYLRDVVEEQGYLISMWGQWDRIVKPDV